MKPIVILVLLLCLRTTVVLGQVKIGDNPQNIDASSVLELESTSKVLVITRVTTSQMDGITPQRGGMVYNTDTECIYYFDGAQWINLCDAVSFGITNAPIVNQRSTISITEATNSYNLEIEPGSIRSVHIATAGINGTNIQNNSIGPDKLGADAVGAEELADGAVGSLNIRDQSITTFDLASDDPNQVLITDEFGVVQWDNASNLTIEVALDIAKNTMDIADHIFEDADTVVGNESLASAIIDGDELVLNESNNETRVDLSGFNDAGTDDQNIVGGEVTGNQLRIDIEGGNSGTIDVSSLTGTGTDNQTLNLNGNLLGITSGNNVNLTKYTNTDNQTINRFDFNTATNQLTLEIQNGGTREITLNNLNNTGTDNQTLSITDDTLEISGGNALPLTAYINTDDQILEIDGNQLTITGLNGGTTIGLPASTVNTDEQQISINADGTEIMLERGGTIALPAGTVDTDDQNLSLAGNTISITDGTGIDLTPILGDVNTDEQNLSLAGTTLNITDGTGVDLAPILGEADTDEQNLSLAGTTLNITNGSSVELGPILGGTNTDEQNLSLTGNTLNITNGTGVDFNSILNLTNILTVGNSAGNSAINNLADPTLPQDAATKSYVDVTVVAAGGGVPTDELNQTFEVNGLNLELTDALGTLQVPLNQINTDNQNAAAVPFAPIGNTLSVDVQSAIVELQTEIDGIPAGEAANPFDELITTFSLTGTELNIAEGANIPVPINLDLIFATDAELASINGSETVVNSSGTVTVAGTGTTGNPYVLTATAGDGSETIVNGSGTVAVTGTGTTGDPYVLTSADTSDGSETIVNSSGTVTVAGTGTTGNPYVLTATAGDGSETVVNGSGTVAVTGTGTTGDPYVLTSADTSDGSETVVNSSGTVTVAGTGTTGNPYVLTATAGDGSETVVNGSGTVAVTGTGTTGDPYVLTSADTSDGSETEINEGANITITGNGTTDTPYIINAEDAVGDGSETEINEGANITITGNGTTATPYVINSIGGSSTAEDITFNPIGNTTSNQVQLAIEELQTEINGISAGGAANPFDELISTFSLTGTELNIAEGANIPAPINLDLIFATDAELASINGSETVVNGSGTVTVAGTGTTGNPYVLTATAGDGSETVVNGSGTVAVTGTGTTGDPYVLTSADTSDGSETVVNGSGTVAVTGTGTTPDPYVLTTTAGDNFSNTDLILDANRTHNLAGFNFVFGGPGNIAVGTLPGAPQSKLDVDGQIQARLGFAGNPGSAGNPSFGFYTETTMGMYRAGNNQLGFSTNSTEAMRIIANGDVGIGVAIPLSNLHVDGDIRANGDILYDGNSTDLVPDYVFQKYYTGKSFLNSIYKFQTLEEIENFIKENKHLPGIKSAAQVKQDGFWNLSKSNIKNLEKIEELFLHTIEQEKKIKSLEDTNSSLTNEVALLIAQMEAIKKMLTAKNNH